MGISIVGGKKNRTAEVDDGGRLKTSAVTESEVARVSRERQSAFVIYGRRNFLAALTDENILYVKYTGQYKLKISSITFSSDSSNAKAELFYDIVYTSGGTALSTDVYILNQNRTSSNPLNVTAYHGGADLVMSKTTEYEVLDVRLSHSTYNTDTSLDGLVLGTNDTFGILGSVAVIGEKIRVMVSCYEVDE